MKRRLGLALMCVAAFGLGGGLTLGLLTMMQSPRPVTTPQPAPAAAPAPPSVRFAAMGDMLAHDSVVNNAAVNDGYDFTKYFTPIRNLYNDRDIVFCNPETPVAGDVMPVSGYPTFNAPREFARDLSAVGCNMINLATNHMYDKGQAGIDASLKNWDSYKPLLKAGAYRTADDSRHVAYATKNDIRIAFVAYRDFSNAAVPNDYAVPSYHNDALVRSQLAEARAQADLVVVAAHWGTEDSTIVNNDQKQAAAMFAELGADVVIGTGPHVVQAVEKIKTGDRTTLVWYSIGNMLSSQLEPNQLTSGIALFTATKTAGRVAISDIGFEPTFMAYDWPAADRAAGRLSARSNLTLLPLDHAGDRITAMFPAETVETRRAYLMQTLGTQADVTFAP